MHHIKLVIHSTSERDRRLSPKTCKTWRQQRPFNTAQL